MLALNESPDIGLKVAQERAAIARDLVRQDIDPQKREARAPLGERRDAYIQTFAVVADMWIGKKSKKWTAGRMEQNR
jgi:hypothetical protein